MRLTNPSRIARFYLDVDTLGWDRGVFVGLVPPGKEWKSNCLSYGIEIHHGGGAGQALRHVFFRWGEFVLCELELGKRIAEGKSYRIVLERTGEGRVHLKVEDIATGGTVIAETIPRYDWSRVLPGTEEGTRPLPVGPPRELFKPLPEGEYEFGIFGWTKRPFWPLPSGSHLLLRDLDLRLAPADEE